MHPHCTQSLSLNFVTDPPNVPERGWASYLNPGHPLGPCLGRKARNTFDTPNSCPSLQVHMYDLNVNDSVAESRIRFVGLTPATYSIDIMFSQRLEGSDANVRTNAMPMFEYAN